MLSPVTAGTPALIVAIGSVTEKVVADGLEILKPTTPLGVGTQAGMHPEIYAQAPSAFAAILVQTPPMPLVVPSAFAAVSAPRSIGAASEMETRKAIVGERPAEVFTAVGQGPVLI